MPERRPGQSTERGTALRGLTHEGWGAGDDNLGCDVLLQQSEYCGKCGMSRKPVTAFGLVTLVQKHSDHESSLSMRLSTSRLRFHSAQSDCDQKA